MNRAERSIIGIAEDTDRQFILRRHLWQESIKPSSQFLSKMLEDEYDVVRSEIIDYLVFNNIRIPKSRIARLFSSESSELVRARLFLLAGQNGMRAMLRPLRDRWRTQYEELYWTAGICLVDREMSNFLKLANFLFHKDRHICETAIDLTTFVSSEAEYAVLRELLKVLQSDNPSLDDRISQTILKLR